MSSYWFDPICAHDCISLQLNATVLEAQRPELKHVDVISKWQNETIIQGVVQSLLDRRNLFVIAKLMNAVTDLWLLFHVVSVVVTPRLKVNNHGKRQRS